jgi:hypothetical protein
LGESYGQGPVDALRFSRMQYLGTARFNAMGGSFGALGGEASGLSINPAGIGVYRNSEFTFSTGLLNTFQESSFRNGLNEESTINFNIPNISFVNSYRGDPNGWKNYSFTFSHNRVNSFRSRYTFTGNNDESSSFIDPYVLDLNDAFPSSEDLINYNVFPFGPAQAFETFAIDLFQDGQGNEFYDRWLIDEESIDQRMEVEESGRQSETFFGFGGNYQDRLYLGGNVGIQTTRHERNVVRYEEYNYIGPPPAGVTDINSYREETNLMTIGTGFNVKFGMIYRITEQLRIGASVHSPTWFRFSEEFTVESNSAFSDGSGRDSEIIESNYDYRLQTPWRFNGSLAYVLGRQGMVNVDYEYVDYSKARFDDVRNFEFNYSPTNRQIEEQLQAAHNVRFGGEVRLDPFVARAGFRYESNPFADNIEFNPDESRMTYSLGGGYRYKNFNFDLSYSYTQMDFVDPFYETSSAVANIVRTDHLVTATFGWRW